MTNIYGSLINGEWHTVGNEIANINPSESSQVLGHLISANSSQIDDAVSSARHAQPLWSAVKLEDKKNILYSVVCFDNKYLFSIRTIKLFIKSNRLL